MSVYRNLNLGVNLVNGVPRSFKRSSFFQPVIDIYNNKGGATNEALNSRLPARCSIFDLSHYSMLRVSAKDKLSSLQKTFTTNIYNCPWNKCRDSLILDNDGKIVDKVLISNHESSFSIITSPGKDEYVEQSIKSMSSNVVVENVSEQYDIFAVQGCYSRAAMNKIFYFLKLNFKNLVHEPHTCAIDTDKIIINKGIIGSSGYLLCIPKIETQNLFIKLLQQPNIYMSGEEALEINRLEARMLGNTELSKGLTPAEANQLHLITSDKEKFIGYDSVFNSNNNFIKPNKVLKSFSLSEYDSKFNTLYDTDNNEVGSVSRMLYSPYLKCYKGFGYFKDQNISFCKSENNQKIELMDLY